MSTEQFPKKLADEIKYYVYRLIDPRNGQTFYVGKGRETASSGMRKGLNTTRMTTGRAPHKSELLRSTSRGFPLAA